MWKIHRYYLKEVSVTAILTFTVLFGIVLIAMIARGIDRAAGGTLMDAAMITFFWTVDTFPHLLTISLLFATVMTFARASQDREVTAIRSAGISPRVPMMSAVLVGVVFSLAGSYLMHQLVPYAHFKKYRVASQVMRSLILNLNLQGDQIPLGQDSGRVMSFRSREGRTFRDCVIFQPGKGEAGGLPDAPVFTAEEVVYDVPDGQEVIEVRIKGIREPYTDVFLPGPVTYTFGLREITEQNRRGEGEKDVASDQLVSEVMRGVARNPGAAQYQVHRRGCFALMPALFAPIGFCLGVMSRDRGRIIAILLTLVPLTVFYSMDAVAARLVGSLDLPILAWLPALVLLVLGTPFCWRLLRL